MKRLLVLLLWSFTIQASTDTLEGVVQATSPYDVSTTASRILSLLRENDTHIFASIDQRDFAKQAGYDVPEAELILFGKPKAFGLQLRCDRRVALDLPQKILVYQDENKVTRIHYNGQSFLEGRYELGSCRRVMKTIYAGIEDLIKEATQ